MQDARKNDRSLAWDVTRAVACAMVVMVHVCAIDFYAFGPLWAPSVVYDAMCRVAVPLFFMLSGALILRKDEPVLPFYRKRIPRLLMPLVFWTIVYVYLFGDRSIPPMQQLAHYLMLPFEHLWYLYTALGLYLAAPYIGRMFRASTDAEIRIFIALWLLVACVLNQVSLFFAESWNPPDLWGAQFFSGFMGYFVLGAYLERCRPVTSGTGRWTGALVFLASSSVIVLGTCLYSTHISEPNEFFFSYLTPLVAISSVAAYLFLTGITTLPARSVTLVRWISDSSLGIYCLHPMLIWLYVKHWHLDDGLGLVWLRIPVIWGAVFVSTAALVYLARKLPPLRRIT